MISLKAFAILCLVPLNSYTQNALDAVLESYKKDKELMHAQVSVCVMDASSGKTLKEYNADMAMIPASTLKVITTSAALGILGKEYTYKTHFYLTQKPDSTSGHYKGDLMVKGSGDPSFNSAYFYSNDSLFFSPLIKKLKSKGIKKIDGSLILDVSAIDHTISSNWIWGDIGNYFGAGANGLSYKDNKFSLFYKSGEPNSEATLETIKPDYFDKKITWKSHVLSAGSEDEAIVFGDPEGYSRTVTGYIPPHKTHYEVEAQMPEPPLFFGYELINTFKKNGMTITNTSAIVTEEPIKTTTTLIYTHTSPKLEKLVYYTNQKSNNHYAESLLKSIGAAKSGKQGTTENGIRAIESYWKDRGLDISGLHMVDGCGLSRANTITTKLQASILSKIFRDSLIYPVVNASLPVAGKNGSMAGLCKGSFAENNLRAKTGYINRARGYCGYVKTKSGKDLAFSVLFNNYDCSAKEAKLKIEKLLIALTEL